MIKISALNIYPVKSLAGIALDSAHLALTGLRHDRSHMAVKQDGTMITQRSHPQMALVDTAIKDNQLVLDSFGLNPMKVPLPDASMARLATEVWGDKIRGIDLGDEVAGWLSQAIDDHCRLVSFPRMEARECDPDFSAPDDHTQFADGFPLLIASQAALDDLNQRLHDKGDASKITMSRFRPNIVVTGCDAFAEDNWRRVVINDVPIRIVKACARCSVPTVNPLTGVLEGPEPIHTLSSYRQWNDEIFFGVNATPDKEGVISVGDVVEVIA